MQSAYALQICDVDKQYGSVCMEMYTKTSIRGILPLVEKVSKSH